jgi:hypothetical protein
VVAPGTPIHFLQPLWFTRGFLSPFGDQTSTTPSTSFGLPIVSNITALWGDQSSTALSTLNTEGGQLLELLGDNFGPSSPQQFVTAVMMGPYALQGCTIATPHVRMLCRTPPGVGTGHAVTVAIADLVSSASEQLLGYAPPVIAVMTPGAIRTYAGMQVCWRPRGVCRLPSHFADAIAVCYVDSPGHGLGDKLRAAVCRQQVGGATE